MVKIGKDLYKTVSPNAVKLELQNLVIIPS